MLLVVAERSGSAGGSAKAAIVSAVASVEALSAITSSYEIREAGELRDQALEQ